MLITRYPINHLSCSSLQSSLLLHLIYLRLWITATNMGIIGKEKTLVVQKIFLKNGIGILGWLGLRFPESVREPGEVLVPWALFEDGLERFWLWVVGTGPPGNPSLMPPPFSSFCSSSSSFWNSTAFSFSYSSSLSVFMLSTPQLSPLLASSTLQVTSTGRKTKHLITRYLISLSLLHIFFWDLVLEWF